MRVILSSLGLGGPEGEDSLADRGTRTQKIPETLQKTKRAPKSRGKHDFRLG